MAAFCSSHIFCIDCRLPWDSVGTLVGFGGNTLVPVADFVLLGGSTWAGLEGRRFRIANVAKPWWQEPAEGGEGELLSLYIGVPL